MPLDKKQQRELDSLKKKLHTLTSRLAGTRKMEDADGAAHQLEDEIRRVENQIEDLIASNEGD